ncbi:MAG: AAA family ATPase, partial [Myxococcales bacterium]|nr:AAA family ATPase [Myxococcales bacterium]
MVGPLNLLGGRGYWETDLEIPQMRYQPATDLASSPRISLHANDEGFAILGPAEDQVSQDPGESGAADLVFGRWDDNRLERFSAPPNFPRTAEIEQVLTNDSSRHVLIYDLESGRSTLHQAAVDPQGHSSRTLRPLASLGIINMNLLAYVARSDDRYEVGTLPDFGAAHKFDILEADSDYGVWPAASGEAVWHSATATAYLGRKPRLDELEGNLTLANDIRSFADLRSDNLEFSRYATPREDEPLLVSVERLGPLAYHDGNSSDRIVIKLIPAGSEDPDEVAYASDAFREGEAKLRPRLPGLPAQPEGEYTMIIERRQGEHTTVSLTIQGLLFQPTSPGFFTQVRRDPSLLVNSLLAFFALLGVGTGLGFYRHKNRELEQLTSEALNRLEAVKKREQLVGSQDPEQLRQRIRLQMREDFERNQRERWVLRKLEVKHLRTYGDLEWEFAPQFNVLLGRNGHGKSYLLRLLTAMLARDGDIAGQYFHIGKNQTSEDDPGLARIVLRRGGVIKDLSIVRRRSAFTRNEEGEGKDPGKIPLLALPDSRVLNKSNTRVAAVSTGLEFPMDAAHHFIWELPYEPMI